jgi:hypothetical protein
VPPRISSIAFIWTTPSIQPLTTPLTIPHSLEVFLMRKKLQEGKKEVQGRK